MLYEVGGTVYAVRKMLVGHICRDSFRCLRLPYLSVTVFDIFRAHELFLDRSDVREDPPHKVR